MRTSYLNIQTRDVIFYALKKKKKKKENIVRVRAKNSIKFVPRCDSFHQRYE